MVIYLKLAVLIVVAGIIGLIDWTLEMLGKILGYAWDIIMSQKIVFFIVMLAMIVLAIRAKGANGYDQDTVVYPAGARVIVDLMCADEIQSVEYSFDGLDADQHQYRIPGLSSWPNIATLGYVARAGTSDLITTTAHLISDPGTVVAWGKPCGSSAPEIYNADYETFAPVIQAAPYPTPEP